MTDIDRLRAHGLFDARVPRYTSYPTAPVFSSQVGAELQAEWLSGLDPAKPVSVYVHIPYCERLCWFCACQTQGTKTMSPVARYVDTLAKEITQIAALLPKGIRMGRLHWGGGTPTILPPGLIRRLSNAIYAAFSPADDFEFAVETDPTMIDAEKVEALRLSDMTRASIGVQDFDRKVQEAIGRQQSIAVTQDCVTSLRDAGVTSLNLDLIYGLPHQTETSLARSTDLALKLNPDRVALFGYAHVPHMSKRQRLIDQSALPGDEARYRLAQIARRRLEAAGLIPIGIDHFAKSGDSLALAAREGRLRRNFQGYTSDTLQTLIGIGASAISRFPQGYVQNAAATAAYRERLHSVGLAGGRGHVFQGEDLLRSQVIEQLLCNFRTDDKALHDTFGPAAQVLRGLHEYTRTRFGNLVSLGPDGLSIRPQGRPLTRIIASTYDAWHDCGALYSKAS